MEGLLVAVGRSEGSNLDDALSVHVVEKSEPTAPILLLKSHLTVQDVGGLSLKRTVSIGIGGRGGICTAAGTLLPRLQRRTQSDGRLNVGGISSPLHGTQERMDPLHVLSKFEFDPLVGCPKCIGVAN